MLEQGWISDGEQVVWPVAAMRQAHGQGLAGFAQALDALPQLQEVSARVSLTDMLAIAAGWLVLVAIVVEPALQLLGFGLIAISLGLDGARRRVLQFIRLVSGPPLPVWQPVPATIVVRR